MQICRKNKAIVALLAVAAMMAIAAASMPALADNSKLASIPLLALTETDSNMTGSVAELELELRDGSEKVFLETFPLTKISTQISMRFAQQISCREMDLDCSGHDFIYTIKATPGIVGGPSAGAAAAVLTTALLKNLPLDNSTVITGTINSGGIIGAVGGLKEKITAAAKEGYKRVLVPKGQAEIKEGDRTTDIFEFGRQQGMEIIEVATLAEAMHYFSGLGVVKQDNLVMEDEYVLAMSAIAQATCSKAAELGQTNQRFATNYETKRLLEEAANLTGKGNELIAKGSYYSGASYCFRANIKQKTILLEELGKKQLEQRIGQAVSELASIENQTNSRNITTLTALQAYMLVKERIVEARSGIEDAKKAANNTKKLAEELAYVEERIYSSQTWSKFFDVAGKSFEISKDEIKKSCLSKLAEAEERKAYAQSLIPVALEGATQELEQAYGYLESSEYELCLYSAAKAKSEADIVISLVGIAEEEAPGFVEQKLNVVENALVKAQRRGFLPIISYSYYDYASVLLPEDPATSALFAEHSLEMSAIDIYFEAREPAQAAGAEESKLTNWMMKINPDILAAFVIGLGAGIFIAVVILRVLSGKRVKTLSSGFNLNKRNSPQNSGRTGKQVKTLASSRRSLRGKKR